MYLSWWIQLLQSKHVPTVVDIITQSKHVLTVVDIITPIKHVLTVVDIITPIKTCTYRGRYNY